MTVLSASAAKQIRLELQRKIKRKKEFTFFLGHPLDGPQVSAGPLVVALPAQEKKFSILGKLVLTSYTSIQLCHFRYKLHKVEITTD